MKQLTQFKKDVGAPEVSPDNKLIAFTYRPSNNIARLWIMKRDGSDPYEFYSSPSQETHDPTWSPDGTQLLFAMGKGENNKLYVIGFDGHDPRVVNDTIDTRGRSDWSLLNLISFDMGGPLKHDVYTMNIDGSNLQRFSDGNNSQGASFSPDGKWIAYHSNETGRFEIYLQQFPRGRKERVSTNGGAQARWRRDGKELLYVAFDDRLMAVPIELSPDGEFPTIGTPAALFTTRVGGAVQAASGRQKYAVAADGKRFLMSTVAGNVTTSPITVIFNWKPQPR
jgi:Tol biopolymer transport system component